MVYIPPSLCLSFSIMVPPPLTFSFPAHSTCFLFPGVSLSFTACHTHVLSGILAREWTDRQTAIARLQFSAGRHSLCVSQSQLGGCQQRRKQWAEPVQNRQLGRHSRTGRCILSNVYLSCNHHFPIVNRLTRGSQNCPLVYSNEKRGHNHKRWDIHG